MFNQEKFNQLATKFNLIKGQDSVYLSNRNFTTLHKLVESKKLKNNHISFAFSYLYLQNYMFRYAKYDQFVPQTGEIKEMLGYSPTQQALDYIIKKGGLLDKEGMTSTIFDFPVIQEWEDNQPVITMLSSFNEMTSGYGSQWRKERGIKTNQSCKFPVYAFVGENEKFNGEFSLNNQGGSFFELSNTTKLDVKTFLYCMSNSDLESTGFYLYSYLKWKCDCIEGEIYGIGYERLARETGLKVTTVKKYIKLLRQYNLVSCQSGTYIVYAEDEKVNTSDLEPNRYGVNPSSWFLLEKQTELTKPNYVYNAQIQKDKAMQEQQSKEIADEMSRLFG